MGVGDDEQPYELGGSIRRGVHQSLDIHKVCIIGDSATGKTSIVIRFTEDRFPQGHGTVGCDCAYKSFVYGDFAYKFNIWDVAGGPTYRDMVPNYFRGAHVFILVYDCTRQETFDNVEEWDNLVRRHFKGDDEHRIVILCGNKIDRDDKTVSTEDGQELATRLGMRFHETSALSGAGVVELFYVACEELTRVSPPRQSDSVAAIPSPTVTVQNPQPQRTNSCCR